MFDRVKAWFTSRNFIWFLAGVVVIAIVSFAFFYPDAQQGNVLQQYDTMQGVANGQEAKAFQELTGEKTYWTNSLFSGMPTFQISPTYPSSTLFTWINGLMGLGLPAPANLLAMMMLGFFILLLTMRLKPGIALLGAIAYGFSTYFIIIIGAGHIWKFVTLAYVPPTIAGVILCYRGRYWLGGALAALFGMMQLSANHLQMTYYFLFVIFAIVLVYLYKAWREKRFASFGIATGVLVIAGALAVGANLPNIYNTYEYSKQTMRGQHSELTAAPAPGQAQAQTTTGLDKNYITQYSYQPSESFSLLIPNIKGGASARPEAGQMTSMNIANTDNVQQKIMSGEIGGMQGQYLSYISQYFGDPEGTNGPVYVGALIFALFLMGCVVVRGPMKWALVVLTIFSLVLAWGKHAMVFTDVMLACVPMYAKFRTVESILVIAEFTMPLLAMLTLQQIFTAENRREMLKPLYWCFGLSALVCVVAWIAPSLFGSLVTDHDRDIDAMIAQQLAQMGATPEQIQSMSLNNPVIYSYITDARSSLLTADALRSLLFLVGGGGIIWLYIKQMLKATGAVIALIVVTLIDLYTVNKRYLSHDSFKAKELVVGPEIPKIAADDLILQDTTMNYRVMDIPRFYNPDASYYHHAIGGYHAAKLTRYQDLIDRHLSHFTQGNYTEADMNVLNMLNPRYIIISPSEAPMYNPDAMGNAWLVDNVEFVPNADKEMEALSTINPRTTAVADNKFKDVLGTSSPVNPGDTIYETSYAPNRLTYNVNSQKGGVAVFSEIYFPWGWEALIDGKPAELGRVNYVLRALKVPAGSHQIEMTFNPSSVSATNTAATLSIILIYVALIGAIGFACIRPVTKKE